MRSAVGVPPGSLVITGSRKRSATRRNCVVLPEPSIPSKVMNMRARCYTFLLLLLIAAPLCAAAERYIIPIWGMDVHGASGTYTGAIAMTNLGDADATVKVTKIVAIASHPCAFGPCAFEQWAVPPHLTRVISDQGATVIFGGRVLDFGAVEIESDRPIEVASEIFKGTWGHPLSWQSVEVARDWITGPSMIPRGIPFDAAFRLYLINPNDFAIRFDYHSDYGKTGTATVAANSIAVIELTSFLGAGGGAEVPTGTAFPLYINAEFPYLAASFTASGVVSSNVRIARPLTKPR